MSLVHADVISRLTLEQKARLTAGADFWRTVAIPEEGIPAVAVSDGPHGLRVVDDIGITGAKPATCFPPAVGLGSSWNTALARRVGEAIGTEAKALGVNVVLGPGVNIKRTPLCGRNFEYFSEDPLVAGAMGAAWVAGAESTGAGTSLKHFAANNQETERMTISAQIDERTLREIYLPAFERTVNEGRPATVMCSYNRINGVYSSENGWLLNTVLRDEWGFDGIVMSDWGAVLDRVASLRAGLDLKMPLPGAVDQVVAAVQSGELGAAALDAAVDRMLSFIERVAPATASPVELPVDAHHALAVEAAAESAVLLKNEGGILPLTAASGRIAVIGEFARTPRYQGAGSSQVVPTRLDSALDALRAALGDRVVFEPGFTLDGAAAGTDAEAARLSDAAVALAREAGTVVLFLGLPGSAESEGFDRADILLPAAQLALLDRIAAVTDRIVVVLSNGALVSVAEWQGKAQAILEGWLLGQGGGAATAALLTGAANPSGRLTETIPVRIEDTPAFLNFPGSDGAVLYGERIYVGYRYYQSRGVPVAYPFGHGLSYTSFAYSDLAIEPTGSGARLRFTVTNTGAVAGSEVAQVYRHDGHSSVDRPEQELVGFAKLRLEPGAATVAEIELDSRAFAYWAAAGGWAVEEGDFELRVGASSRDIRLVGTVHVDASGPVPQLTAMSSIARWFADPIGGPLLRGLLASAPGGQQIDFDPSTTEGQMFLAIPLGTMMSLTPAAPSGGAEALLGAVHAVRGGAPLETVAAALAAQLA